MFYAIENIPSAQVMQAVVAELLPLVPFARRDKALQYKHLHGQYCCLRSWKMLHELLLEHAYLPATFPLADLTYSEDAYGKPSLNCKLSTNQLLSTFNVQLSTFNFSLSHTKTALGVAIDHQPIGIDIESIISDRRLDPAFLARTMSAAEQARIASSGDPRRLFTELWTRKEALFKAIGTGIEMSTLPTILEQTSPFTIDSYPQPDCICSIAYRL